MRHESGNSEGRVAEDCVFHCPHQTRRYHRKCILSSHLLLPGRGMGEQDSARAASAQGAPESCARPALLRRLARLSAAHSKCCARQVPVWRGESTSQLAYDQWKSPQNVKRLPTADGVITDSPNVFNRAQRARHPVQCAGMICCSANCCRCVMVSGISRSIAVPARCKPPSTPYSGTSGNASRAFNRTLMIPACEHELKTMSPFPCTLTAT